MNINLCLIVTIMRKIIYLDNAATTKVHKKVAAEMHKYFLDFYGNPSSSHQLGEKAYEDIKKARTYLAKTINAKPWELIFTSGGTESNNLAIQGLAMAYPNKKKIIISPIEHSSIEECCEFMKSRGYQIVKVCVDEKGLLDLNLLEKEIDSNTLLVSIMHANSEIGVIQNIKKIGEVCRRKNVFFHTDALQSFSKEKIDVRNMNVDLLSAAAHKLNGSKGIGFLYVREGISIKPMIHGGGQEKGLRGGTENVPAIMGFAKAVELSSKINKEKIRKLRDKFIKKLEKMGGKINGSRENRIYNNVHVSFSGLDAETAVIFLSRKGIMCSTGSACDSRKKIDKRALKAIGLDEKEIKGSLRFSLNEEITEKDIDYTVKEIKKLI